MIPRKNDSLTKNLTANKENLSLFRQSFLGGIVLFGLAFPLINIFIADHCYFHMLYREERMFFKYEGLAVSIYWLIIIILWICLLNRYHIWASTRNLFKTKIRINRRTLILLSVLVMGYLGFFILIPHENSLFVTYDRHRQAWGPAYGAINTMLLYVYYFIEGILMIWITDAFQTAGSVLSRSAWIPWGGLGLALTWGASHFYTKGPSMGTRVVLFSLFFGILYMIGKRNALPPILAWMLNYFY